MKRLFDVLAASLGLVILSPVLLVSIVLVIADSPGPAIFSQTRVGRYGKLFVLYKLRTMFIETQEGPSHQTSATAVTRTGRRLRAWKLDELPQLWNVLKGEMSIVGPRPCLPSQRELIAARKRRGVDILRPGITGMAQVQGIDMTDPERLAEQDARYLDKQGLITDVRIILATVSGSGRGDRVGHNN